MKSLPGPLVTSKVQVVTQRCLCLWGPLLHPWVPKLCHGPGTGELRAVLTWLLPTSPCLSPCLLCPAPNYVTVKPRYIYRVCCQGPQLLVENILVVSWTAFSFPDCWEKKISQWKPQQCPHPPSTAFFWGADTLFCVTFNLGRYLTTLPQFSMSNTWHKSVYSCFIQLG